MKKYLIAILLLLVSFGAQADGPDKYTLAMKSALSMMDTSRTIPALQNCANRFERIGNAEKKEWLPYYYAALCHFFMSYIEPDMGQKDALLDKAESYLEKTKGMKVKDFEKSELAIMKGMIYGSRIQVDPQTRGMKYGPLSGQQYARAASLDPKNPRPDYLQGQSAMFTPEMWGGGRDKAIVKFEAAIEKFKAWKAPNEIHPDWGLEDTEKMLAMAKSGEKAPWEEEMEKATEEDAVDPPSEEEVPDEEK